MQRARFGMTQGCADDARMMGRQCRARQTIRSSACLLKRDRKGGLRGEESAVVELWMQLQMQLQMKKKASRRPRMGVVVAVI